MAKNLTSSSADILAKLSRFYPLLLFFGVVCLTWLLAKSIWLMIAPPTAPALNPVNLQPQTTDQITGNYLDFFMKPDITTPTQPPPDIQVLGVTLAVPEKFSFAILSANNKVKNYQVGDMIEGSSYQLLKVTTEYVEIADKNGQNSQIPFGQPFALDQSAVIRAKSQTQLQGDSLTNATMSMEQTSYPEDMFAQQAEIAVPPNPAVNALEQAVNEIQQDPAAYFSKIGVFATGQGYEVSDTMPEGLRSRLGLQMGDKVVSVNGQNVGQNIANDIQLLQQIRQSGQAEIQVQRGEQTITLRQAF